MLDALAARDGNPAEANDEVFDQRRLANARFTGYPDDSPPTIGGLTPGEAQPDERIGPTNERRRVARMGEHFTDGRLR